MKIKETIKELPILRTVVFGRALYFHYKNTYNDISMIAFLLKNICRFKLIKKYSNKSKQIYKLLAIIDILPVSNDSFFYSIDTYKSLQLKCHILDNFTIDYSSIVNGSLDDIRRKLLTKNDLYANNEIKIVDAIELYISRLNSNEHIVSKYGEQIEAINSLKTRPAKTFFEGLQRILFINQLLWQTAHKHNGIGHIDWLLIDLYENDINQRVITRNKGRKLIEDFFLVLHENCWYKSTMLLGDTGQIIILGGCINSEEYKWNELTGLFIETATKLKLPDPKVLLRVSSKMPNYLLELALKCISTGIGAPFLSNDDKVIPSLLSFGYSKDVSYHYVTSACWEPLVLSVAFDQNNIETFNFCVPFIELLTSDTILTCNCFDDVLRVYYQYLEKYTDQLLNRLDNLEFEEDPLFSLFSISSLNLRKDFTRGGAYYNDLGLTSVGMSTVVNSLLNIRKYIFVDKRYSMKNFISIQKGNFKDTDQLVKELNLSKEIFGSDDLHVIDYVNDIMKHTSVFFNKHMTTYGGRYKFGLSSPSYVDASKDIPATFDGRKAGMPFGVHISGKNGTPPTEVISFASQLDYSDNRINGNVVDIMMSPSVINENFDKIVSFLKSAIFQGFYQLQINVVDSTTLIKAKQNPELFPNLVVRVWGFSAYFKDLPVDYQDVLIQRALENEGIS